MIYFIPLAVAVGFCGLIWWAESRVVARSRAARANPRVTGGGVLREPPSRHRVRHGCEGIN